MKVDRDYQLIKDDLENDTNRGPLTGGDKFSLEIRLGFIRKVYGILSMQLLLSTIMCMLSMYSTSFFQFQMENFGLMIFSLIVTMVLPCFALCFNDMFRKVPTNYIFLFTFTIFESYIIGFICGMTNPAVVLMAAFMTFAMVIGLTLYAFNTKHDITLYGGSLVIVGLAILLFAICVMFTNNSFLQVCLSTLWVILFGVYLVYDTQLILGKGELQLSIDDYILASFMLYLDVINLFINLLTILRIFSGDSN